MKKIIIIISTILIIITTLFIINKIQIKNRFNKYVITNKETNIYDKNHAIIGKTKENIYYELEKANKKYYKINETNYYLYYKDVNKTEKQTEEKKEYYRDLGKEITTNEITNFYKNNELKFTINNSFTFNVNKENKEYYYITYMNQIYQIKKEEIKEEKK